MSEVRVHVQDRPAGKQATGVYHSVLLVEDRPGLRRVIARNLSGRGIMVSEVGTAEEVIALPSTSIH
jgi:ActR/RegA family two-component response regulator